MGHRSIRRPLLALACMALCLSVAGCDAVAGRARNLDPVRGPVIAVLAQLPSRVILLEPDSLKRMGKIRLRSQSIGMTTVGDMILTAQCGAPGDASDTRIGFVEPYAGRIDYLDLKILDPEEIWAADEGWCFVLNGLIDPKGMRCERIDPKARTFTELAFPPAGQAGTGAGKVVWVLRKEVRGEQDRVTEEFLIFRRTGEPRVVSSETTATFDLCGFGDIVITVEQHADGTRLIRRNAETGERLSENVIPGVTAGPGCAWPAGPVLALADQEHGEGQDVRELVLVDPATLQALNRIPVDGVGAVGPAGDGRIVVCEANGDVGVYLVDGARLVAGTNIDGPIEELVEVGYVQERPR